jgi:type VI secretion system protein ImpM
VAGPTTGYFGKLPGLGDFAHRGLPSSFVRPWDGWLQRTLPASRALLGPGWLKLYLASPFWRFVLAPGVCGPQGWMGVLMPSADRVGRTFPLTLARTAPPGRGIVELALCGPAWFAAVEALLLAALHPEHGLERLNWQLPALPELPAVAGLAAAGPQRTPLVPPPSPVPPAPAAAAHGSVRGASARLAAACSCWSATAAAPQPASLRVWTGLPPAAAYAALLASAAAVTASA